MNFRDAEEMTEVAGEYVLSLLPQNEVDEVEREIERNHAFAAAVGFWRDRFLELAPPTLAVEPAADTWRRIRRDIQGVPRDSESAGWWNSLSFWRGTGLAGSLGTLLLSFYLIIGPRQQEEPKYLAVLQSPGQGASWLVEVREDAVHLRPLAAVALPPGRSVQFWTKPLGAQAPTSLGLVPYDRPVTVAADTLPGIAADQLFEVTLEPESGSPTGRPTGPILAVGKAIRL